MSQMQHDPDVVGFYGTLKRDNGLKLLNEDLYRKQELLIPSSMPLHQPT